VLDANSPLNGFDETINDIRISEVTGLSILSLAVPLTMDVKFKDAVRKTFGLALPEPGRLTSDTKIGTKLLWTAPDQIFALQDESRISGIASLKDRMGSNAYLTDQSDSWAILALGGDRVLQALERICPIDLNPAKFKTGMAARTHMEHLGVFILRVEDDTWWLMSARSSAGSFLHAVTQSAKNI